MSNDSKIFDKIRIKSRRGKSGRPEIPLCGWDGCDKPGTHKAPKSQKSDGEFHNFCIKHVRQYNQSFNYFAEMKEDEIAQAMRKSARTGEQPTWKMGSNPDGKGNPSARQGRPRNPAGARVSDPLHLFARLAARKQGTDPNKPREIRLRDSDRKALEVLGLKGQQAPATIKTAYKDLVKKHHPDANGGDRGSEDRLRAIITAYTHLKKKGFV